MPDLLTAYGLFLAKTLTLLVAATALVLIIAGASRGGRGPGERLEVKSLNRRYDRLAAEVQRAVLPRRAWRAHLKDMRRRHKARGRGRRIFVIDFQGDLRASAVTALREEVSAVLLAAAPTDEVLVRVENAGGLVHEHGLAASQLARIRDGGLRLTVAVDKVAASGGYLMACVAQHIIAAPFAILGSIGVVAQLPNFHRWLREHGVEVEQFKAGEYKRTVTMFGENTDADRAKLQEQLELTHELFKGFVARFRPGLDLQRVATGEYWYGTQALELGLADELLTSDDYLLKAREEADIYSVRYVVKRGLRARLGMMAREALARLGG